MDTTNLLCKAMGKRDPAEAVIARAVRLYELVKPTSLPVAANLYAEPQAITRIIPRNLKQLDGRIFELEPGPGYCIELARDRSEERQRFTCAHEIAHTFFFEVSKPEPSTKQRFREDADVFVHFSPSHKEEYLCNLAAAELLMPFGPLFRLTREMPPSLLSVIELAKAFKVSLTACALRLAQTQAFKCMIIVWQPENQEQPTFRPKFCVSTLCAQHAPRVHTHGQVPHLLEAWISREIVRGQVDLDLEEGRDRYYLESIRLGPKANGLVLSLVIFSPDSVRRVTWPERGARPQLRLWC